MSNLSTFRASHGTDIDRLTYETFGGIVELFNVTVTSERKLGIYVNADEVVGEGAHRIEGLFIGLSRIREVSA